MPVAGRKPEERAVNHVPPVHEWREVPADARYRGRKPALPKDTPAETRAWWRDVTSLPHCAFWDSGDWSFARDTARVHAAFVQGDMARASELRLRERAMGTTADARRDLRIRYVAVALEAAAESRSEAPSLADLAAERRRRLTSAS